MEPPTIPCMSAIAIPHDLHPWRALLWEPVTGTGERLMIGVVYRFEDVWGAARIIRDDVLDSLYGSAAAGVRNLLDFGISLYRDAASAANSLEGVGVSLAGLHPTEVRHTAALSVGDLLRIAALMHSSLANLDKLDALDDTDLPLPEEVNRRFGTDVRGHVLSRRPDLESAFGRSGLLVAGGEPVKFGFTSNTTVAHFNVLSPIRPGPSLRDARARIFELQRCREIAHIGKAALISAVPREDDATLGDRQRARLFEVRTEIASEAEAVNVRYLPVHTASDGAMRLLEVEAA